MNDSHKTKIAESISDFQNKMLEISFSAINEKQSEVRL